MRRTPLMMGGPSLPLLRMAFLSVLLLAAVSSVSAASVSFSPASGLLTIKETDLARKLTLSFADYAPQERLNITVTMPSDLVLLNESSYVSFNNTVLELFLAPTSANYGIKQVLFGFSNGSQAWSKTYDVLLITSASPPIIEEVAPSGLQSGSVVTISVRTNEEAVCKFDTQDTSYQDMRYLFSQTGAQHDVTWRLEDGTYLYHVRCMDNESNVMAVSNKISFIIDTKGPEILFTSPKFTVTRSTVDLQVRTDEPAQCRYAVDFVTYDAMSPFDISDGKDHYKSLVNLSSGVKDYFVQCKDQYGNTGDVAEIIFTVDQPPTAAVQLSAPLPLRAGKIGVTVVTSEELKELPELKYSLGESSAVKVPLTGSGNLYTGYMIIDDVNENKVGEFTIKMRGIHDVEGTRITSGNTFVVQTKILPKIRYLSAQSDDRAHILLDWYLDKDQQDAKHYNIYRSMKQDVSQLDFYKKVSASDYVDADTKAYETYYYRVAAVDDAGNVGILSEVASAVAIDKNLSGLTDEQRKTVADVEKELQETKEELSSLDFDPLLDRYTGFGGQVEAAKERINAYLAELSGFRGETMTDAELASALEEYRLSRIQIRNGLVRDIKATQEPKAGALVSENQVFSLMNEYLVAKRLTDLAQRSIDEYFDLSKGMTDDLAVDVTLTNYDVLLFDGTKKEYAVMSFDVSSTALHDADLIIEIPKSIAGDITEMRMQDSRYMTVNRDPVISLDYAGKDTLHFTMMVEDTILTRDILDIRAVLLAKTDTLLDGLSSANSITGNLLLEDSLFFAKRWWLLALCLIVIAGLATQLIVRGGRRGGSDGAGAVRNTPQTQAMIRELKESLRP